MMPHAFLAWGWTVYLADMMDFADMEAVKESLAPCMFLDGSSPFCFTVGRRTSPCATSSRRSRPTAASSSTWSRARSAQSRAAGRPASQSGEV
jgi:hypothetical protein